MNSTNAIMYPFIPDNALRMSIEALQRTTLSQVRLGGPLVRAASALRRNSCTEVIDVNRLAQMSPTNPHYVEIVETEGQLYCMDRVVSTACWLKVVPLAKDCQSCNVLLMTTNEGVVLRVVRSIAPGEPLSMWFTENVIAMLNIPFLTPSNIQGENRYICHTCHGVFEYPNYLKIHLALKCNQLDSSHLWALLAKEFRTAPKANLFFGAFPQSTFKFDLNNSLQTSAMRISPILVETMEAAAASLVNNSPASSTHASPSSSNQVSPNSSTQISPSSSAQASPVKNAWHRHSAFKPYMSQPNGFPNTSRPGAPTEESILPTYNFSHPAQVDSDLHAAQMEMIVSNLGKSGTGHVCIYCGKAYSRKYGLKIHIRTHTGYKPLKCKYCQRPFGDPSNLNKHVRLHADGETPYKCDLCGKVLVRRRDLERHMKSRHQENGEQISDSSSDGIEG